MANRLEDYNKHHVSLMVGYGYGKAVKYNGSNKDSDNYINSLKKTNMFTSFIGGYYQGLFGKKLSIPNLPQFNDDKGGKFVSNSLYSKNGYDGRKHTPKEKQAYHNACAKKGSKYVTKNGEEKERTAFNRGYHKAQADKIGYYRGLTKARYENSNN